MDSTDTTATPRRWISVVFLQGEEAETVLDLIEQDGTIAAIHCLAGFDYGDETTDAAMENGYVYDEPPIGKFDRTATRDGYTLTYNEFFNHVGLLRELDLPPDPNLLDDTTASRASRAQRVETSAAAHHRQRNSEDTAWFARPTSVPRPRRELSL